MKNHGKKKKIIQNTLASGDYNSFAMAVLSQNYREINIRDSILVSIKVIITSMKGFLYNDIMVISII